MFARIPCAVEQHEVLSGASTYPCQTSAAYLWLQQLPRHKGNLLVCASAEFRPDWLCNKGRVEQIMRVFSSSSWEGLSVSATHLWRQRQRGWGGAAGRAEARQGWDAEWDFQTLRHTEEGSKQARKQASSLISQTVEVRVPASREWSHMYQAG